MMIHCNEEKPLVQLAGHVWQLQMTLRNETNWVTDVTTTEESFQMIPCGATQLPSASGHKTVSGIRRSCQKSSRIKNVWVSVLITLTVGGQAKRCKQGFSFTWQSERCILTQTEK